MTTPRLQQYLKFFPKTAKLKMNFMLGRIRKHFGKKRKLGRTENILGKGENADYQHFLLFLQCFQRDSSSGSLKVGTVLSWVKPSSDN